jgi:hypothetical protein
MTRGRRFACEAKEESEEEAILYHTTCHVRLHRYLSGLPIPVSFRALQMSSLLFSFLAIYFHKNEKTTKML